MTHASSLSIVKDARPLAEDFVPDHLIGRERQLQQLRDGLDDSGSVVPRHFWLHGPAGSGKSSLVRQVLGDLETQGIRTAYVNCWSAQTFFAILEAIFQELRALVGDQRDVAFKFERLQRLTRDLRLVLVLDEIDQVFFKERNACLYNFSRLENTRVVCIGQTRATYEELDPRVRSRIQPVFLGFGKYDQEALEGILAQRAEASLLPESWCHADLETIAQRAQGDARVAIQGLRTAAYLAEKRRTTEIRAADIEAGMKKSSELRRRYVLGSLSEHHRLLHRLVRDAGSITIRGLWTGYLARCRELQMQPMARRTFNYYRRFLIQNRLLAETQARGQSNTRVLRAVQAEEAA